LNCTTRNFYTEIIQQVILVERCRHDLNKRLLSSKNRAQKRQLMLSFLCLDIEKHQLFASAAQVAVQDGDETVIRRLHNFYRHNAEFDNIVMIIQDEINKTRKFIHVIQRSLHGWAEMSFAEKRLAQEIEKYIIVRAQQQ